MSDSHKKSFAKAISWRILATLTTIIISYAVTHHIGAALSIGSIEVFVKIALYYGHERLWTFINKAKSRFIQTGVPVSE